MIQAVMLVMLGFLLASLCGLLLAPSLWSRAARLTRRRIEATLPMTLNEIEAAQDRVRGDYAVRIRRLESSLSRAKQKAALQLVDNSRQQMQLASLKDTIQQLETQLDERRNAATVFEQTIRKRFPELENEIDVVRERLSLQAVELQDLANKLKRKDESLELAHRRAATFEEEVNRLRNAMEKSSTDRSGRLLRRPSQWTIDDYRSEYDRLNLELSKLRQQLAQLQERESHQVSLVKTELQKLSEVILVASEKKVPALGAVATDAPARIASAKTADVIPAQPIPWPAGRAADNAAARTAALPLARATGVSAAAGSSPQPPVRVKLASAPAEALARPVSPAVTAKTSPETPGSEGPRPSNAARPPITRSPGTATAVLSGNGAGKTANPSPSDVSEPAVATKPEDATAARPGNGISDEASVPGTSAQNSPAIAVEPDGGSQAPVAGKDAPGTALAIVQPAAASESATAEDTPEKEEPAAKPFADARDLRALSELLTMNAGQGAEAPKQDARNNHREVAREARQGVVIEGEAATDVLEPADADGGKSGNRSLLDRLRTVPERAELDK